MNLATTSASPQHIEESNAKYLVCCGLERRVPTYNYGTLAMIEIALSNISQYSCSCNRPAVFKLQFKDFKKCPMCWRELILHYLREVGCVVSLIVPLCLLSYRSSVIPLPMCIILQDMDLEADLWRLGISDNYNHCVRQRIYSKSLCFIIL